MRFFKSFHGFGSFLEEDEVIEAVFRQKFSYFLSEVFIIGLLWFGWAWVVYFFYPRHLFLLTLALSIGGMVHILGLFLWWYYNAILMTNMNVIIVKWQEILHKKITRIDYWNLDEIAVEKKGWGAFMYHYGTLIFQKLSDGEPILYRHIGYPTRVATIIDDYKEKVVHERNFSSDAGIKDLLADALGRHIEKNGVAGPPTLQNKISRVGQDGIALKKPKEVAHYRSHWRDFIPWNKKSEQDETSQAKDTQMSENFAQNGENPKKNGENVQKNENEEGNEANEAKWASYGGKTVEVHHHHHYGPGHAPHFPSREPINTPKRPQSEAVSVISGYQSEAHKKSTYKHKKDAVVMKKMDDAGGLSLEIGHEDV